jgi:hypothetical protein
VLVYLCRIVVNTLICKLSKFQTFGNYYTHKFQMYLCFVTSLYLVTIINLEKAFKKSMNSRV